MVVNELVKIEYEEDIIEQQMRCGKTLLYVHMVGGHPIVEPVTIECIRIDNDDDTVKVELKEYEDFVSPYELITKEDVMNMFGCENDDSM